MFLVETLIIIAKRSLYGIEIKGLGTMSHLCIRTKNQEQPVLESETITKNESFLTKADASPLNQPENHSCGALINSKE